MGDYFEGFVQEEAKQMGRTIGEIQVTRRRKEAGNIA